MGKEKHHCLSDWMELELERYIDRASMAKEKVGELMTWQTFKCVFHKRSIIKLAFKTHKRVLEAKWNNTVARPVVKLMMFLDTRKTKRLSAKSPSLVVWRTGNNCFDGTQVQFIVLKREGWDVIEQKKTVEKISEANQCSVRLLNALDFLMFWRAIKIPYQNIPWVAPTLQ